MHSQKDIIKLFLKIRDDSYSDLCLDSNLRFETMGFTGYSSPFTGDVSINIERINNEGLSKDAVKGIIAHELGHQVSYRTRSFFAKWIFLWNYYLSLKKRRKVEDEADRTAIRRGYGKELLQERISTYNNTLIDEKVLRFIKKAYMPPEEIRRLMK